MPATPKSTPAATNRLPSDCGTIAAGVSVVLADLRRVVASLSADEYQARSGPRFSGATIGGHVRHCLDHARAVIDAGPGGVVDYDHRERGTSVERDRDAALAELDRLADGLAAIASRDADTPLTVAIMPTREGVAHRVGSTLARELAFVLSHTVHHNATVRGIATDLGRSTPESFGYAPSTLAHQDASACAR